MAATFSLAQQEPFALMFTLRMQRDVISVEPPQFIQHEPSSDKILIDKASSHVRREQKQLGVE